MPMVRAMRLMNSIEAGNTTSAQLQQYLTNGGIYSDFSSILQLPGQCSVLAASTTAIAAINGSALAVTAMGQNTIASAAFSANTTARSSLQTTYRTLLGSLIAANPGVWYPYNTWSSTTQTMGGATRTAYPNYANSVTYGNGVFLAVFNSSTSVYSSSDGINWSIAGTITRSDPSAIVYGSISGTNYWIVIFGGLVGTSNNVFNYSTNNGATWTAGTMPSSAPWVSIAFANNTFVAIAGGSINSSASAYSTNGTTFTAGGALTTSTTWIGIAGGLIGATTYFVAISGFINSQSAAAYSTNGGVSWTISNLPSGAYWQGIAYGNQQFVAVAGETNRPAGTGVGAGYNNIIARNTTGTSWVGTGVTFNGGVTSAPSCVCWNGSYFIAFCCYVALSDSTAFAYQYSTNGASWSSPTYLNQSASYMGNSITCCASNGTITIGLDSSAGSSGYQAVIPNAVYGGSFYAAINNFQISSNIAYGNGLWVALFPGGYYSSTDGVTWTVNWNSWLSTNTYYTYYSTGGFTFITYTSGYWFIGSYTQLQAVLKSTNLTTNFTYSATTTASLGFSNYVSNGVYVLGTTNSTTNRYVVSSDSGASFSEVTSFPSSAAWINAAVGGGSWGVVASSGAIAYSAGSSPSFVAGASTPSTSNCIAYGNGIWVVGGVNAIYYATTINSGSAWGTAVVAGTVYAITYVNGYFFAWANPNIYYSKDGITWTIQPSAGINSSTNSTPFAFASNSSNGLTLLSNTFSSTATPIARQNQ